MAFTDAQHHYFANQHLRAAKGLKSQYKNSDLSVGQHYVLAREHRNAARGLRSKFDRLDGVTRPAPSNDTRESAAATPAPANILVATPISSKTITNIDAFLKIPFQVEPIFTSGDETLYRVSTEVRHQAYANLAAIAMFNALKACANIPAYDGFHYEPATKTAMIIWDHQ